MFTYSGNERRRFSNIHLFVENEKICKVGYNQWCPLNIVSIIVNRIYLINYLVAMHRSQRDLCLLGLPIEFHGIRDKAFLSHGIRDSQKNSHGIRALKS